MTDPVFDFAPLTDAGFPIERYEAGESVFSRDDSGSTMYVVGSGRVSIIAGGTVLENIGPGGIFGEMALIDGAPRSANAVASETSEVAPIDRDAFLYLVRKNPEFALQVMQVMAKRIRRMNENL